MLRRVAFSAAVMELGGRRLAVQEGCLLQVLRTPNVSGIWSGGTNVSRSLRVDVGIPLDQVPFQIGELK